MPLSSDFWGMEHNFCCLSHSERNSGLKPFSPSAVTRKLAFMAYLRGTAETCIILIFD